MIPFGKARVVREGSDLTIVACGALVRRSVEAAKIAADQNGIDVEILDLRTLNPLDMDRVGTSVKKTGRVIVVHESKLLPADWQTKLPLNSSPYVSTLGFLVRKGNPKGIKDWDDLVKPGIAVITPNPKTSGVARWNYLAAWGYALKANNGDQNKAREYIAKLFKNVPVLDSGARGATTTFIERGIGDVLINWENELLLVSRKTNPGRFEIVVPSVSILAEPTVALVERNAKRKGTSEVARAYLDYLYSEEGQEIAAKNFYRPTDKAVAAKYADSFPKLTLFTIAEVFGGWQKAHQAHFTENASFDQIYRP
jgi:sulfate transport system substrate-binding protein